MNNLNNAVFIRGLIHVPPVLRQKNKPDPACQGRALGEFVSCNQLDVRSAKRVSGFEHSQGFCGTHIASEPKAGRWFRITLSEGF
jgi:hypothetical protein